MNAHLPCTIGLAAGTDLPEVLALLNGASAWLGAQGLDQWQSGFDDARIGPMIERREVYVARAGTTAVATVSLTATADPDFWTAQEQAEPALYVAKLATARDHTAPGMGALLLRWCTDLAARQGRAWARLDAWRNNPGLHHYYRRIGWTHLRTVELQHRRSGALFQHPAIPDPQADRLFVPRGPLPALLGCPEGRHIIASACIRHGQSPDWYPHRRSQGNAVGPRCGLDC